MYKNNIWLVNPEWLKAESYIDTNVDEKSIRIAERWIQDRLIDSVLGGCLAAKLYEYVCSGTTNALYDSMLRNYVLPVFIWGVPIELGIPQTFKDRNAGRVTLSDDAFAVSALSDIREVNAFYREKVDFYTERLIGFVQCYRKELAPDCNIPCCKEVTVDFFGFSKNGSVHETARRQYHSIFPPQY